MSIPFATVKAVESVVAEERRGGLKSEAFAERAIKAAMDSRLGPDAMVVVSEVQMPQAALDLQRRIVELQDNHNLELAAAERKLEARTARMAEVVGHLLEELGRARATTMVDDLIEYASEGVPPASEFVDLAQRLTGKFYSW